jgi:uncharacterized repeat protein (TIGR03803 family)
MHASDVGASAFPGTNGKIAFSRTADNIIVMNADGSGQTPVPNTLSGLFADWSPDGRKIVFTGTGGEIVVINADGTGRTPLTDVGSSSSNPKWSPDGSQIVFQRLHTRDAITGASGIDIYVINADGTGLTQLTDGTELALLSYSNLYNQHPNYSPDGRTIAFLSVNFTPDGLKGELWLMDATGGAWRQLTVADPVLLNSVFYFPDQFPTWSPDGKTIAFSRNLLGGSEIMTVDVGTGGMTQLTNLGTSALAPSWSPDRTRITFSAAGHIYTMAADGSQLTAISGSVRGDAYPSWQRTSSLQPPATEQPPQITSAGSMTFTAARASSFTVTTTGSPTVGSIFETGALPAGVTFTNNGDATATLSGTPAAGTGGVYSITITASNGVIPDATQLFALTVTEPIVATPPETTLTSYPPSPSLSPAATFTFSSNFPDSVFACSLDGAAFTTCASPKSYVGLADGRHTFQVLATAANMTDPTPASSSWTITLLPGYEVLHYFAQRFFDFTQMGLPTGLTRGMDGLLYGTTTGGGAFDAGTFYRIDASGNFVVLHSFGGSDGEQTGQLIQARDGSFYGTTLNAGATNAGTIFKIDSAGNFTRLHELDAFTEGSYPAHGVMQASDGYFYGTTDRSTGNGTLFRMDSAGHVTVLHVFDFTEGAPEGKLIEGPDGNLYGTTLGGDADGTVFRATPSGAVTFLHTFVGAVPNGGGLVPASDGYFYGLTFDSIYRIDINGNFAIVHGFFFPTEGVFPSGKLMEGSDGHLYGTTAAGGLRSGAAFRLDRTGNVTVIHPFAYFDGDGNGPGDLVQGIDGALYGTLSSYDSFGTGVVFRLSLPADAAISNLLVSPATGTAGATTTLSAVLTTAGTPIAGRVISFSLNGVDVGSSTTDANGLASMTDVSLLGFDAGTFPGAIQAVFVGDGTYLPASNSATLTITPKTTPETTLTFFPPSFSLSSAATFIFSSDIPQSVFACSLDGAAFSPCTSPKSYLGLNNGAHTFLVQAIAAGIVDPTPFSYSWTVSLTPDYQILHYFGQRGLDFTLGAFPEAPVTAGSDGFLYGTTGGGGTFGLGTVFRVDASGNYQVLHSFDLSSFEPAGQLIQARDGSFYGTTLQNSAVFNIDTAGNFRLVHVFDPLSEGSYPAHGVMQASDGYFYGTTDRDLGAGTLFRMDSGGNLTVLHVFDLSSEGAPEGKLIEGPDGNLYGTTLGGVGSGTVFRATKSGAITFVHTFDPSTLPTFDSGLFLASDGFLYGTTSDAIYRIDVHGNFAFVHTFTANEGLFPTGKLIQATDGNLYGTVGTIVFRMDLNGNVTTVRSFGSPGDGNPSRGVVQGSDGALYGTGSAFGVAFAGIVYRLTTTPPVQPVIVVTSPSEPIYERDSQVFAQYTCLYSQTCTSDVANGAALDTSTPGLHSFTITATAFGNVTTERVEYTVSLGTPVPRFAGLTAWLPGDATARDIVTGTEASWTGTPLYTTGKVAQAFSVGSGNGVMLPFAQSGPFTLQAWVRTPNRLQPEFSGVISSGGVGQAATTLQLELDGFGNYRLNAGSGDVSILIGPATDFFQHLAVTFDGATIAAYLNGRLVEIEPWFGSPDLGFTTLTLGLDRDGQLPFEGIVDEVQLFNRALSPDEILQTFEAGASGLEKNRRPTAAAAATPNPAEATGPGGATALLDGTASSDPDGDPLTYAWTEGPTTLGAGATISTVLAIGSHIITLTVDDGHGHTSSIAVTTVVQDTTGPVLALPSSVLVEATSASGATATFTATAIDAVTGAAAVACLPASGSTFAAGATVVTCTATDANGNTSTGRFEVLVRDTTPPVVVISTPSPDALITTSSSDVVVQVSDAIGVASVSVNGVPASLFRGTAQAGAWRATVPVVPGASTTVTVTAIDASGNAGTATRFVDNDGIPSIAPAALDRGRTDGADLSGVFSNDFNNGVTSGTLVRNGWIARLSNAPTPNGVRVQAIAAGTGPARVLACVGAAKEVRLDVVGETADITCDPVAGTITVRAVSAVAKIEVWKQASPTTFTVAQLPTGATYSTGSPATAAESNTMPIRVQVLRLDRLGALVVVGSFELPPGASVDVTTLQGRGSDAEEVHLRALRGVIPVTLEGRTKTLRPGKLTTIGRR